MAGNRRLVIEIFGDAKGLASAFGATDSHLGRLSRGIGRAGLAAGAAFAGIAGAAVVAAPSILRIGTELETAGIKAATVFSGGALAGVEAWADGTAAAMGLSSDRAVGLAANMGDLLKPMGFTADQAADMSTEMVGLAGALSAWSGGTIDAAGVADIMTKAMLGETDGLKALGISISAAEVSARLAANGQAELTGEALAQAEALAIQQLILEKSTDAQAAWTDGSMDGIKAQNEMNASIDNVKEGLVKALFPALQAAIPYVSAASQWLGERMPAAMEVARAFVMDELVPAFQDHVLPVLQEVVSWVQANWPQIQAVIVEVMRTVQETVVAVLTLVQAFWDRFGGHILNLVRRVFPQIVGVIRGAVDIIQGVIRTFTAVLQGDWTAAWEGVKQIVSGAWQVISGIVGFGVGAVRTVFEAAWELVKSAVATALAALEAAWGATFGRLLGPIQAAIDKVQTLIGWVQQAANAIASLNPLDDGGADASDPSAGSGSWGSDSGPRSATMKPRIAGRSSMGGGPMVVNLHVDGRLMGRAVAAASRRDGGYDFRLRAGG